MILKKYYKEFLLFIFSSFVLFFTFQFNTFNTVNDKWFQTYDLGSEALVIGRLVNSRENGLLSSGGRLGVYQELSGERNELQSLLYLKKIKGGVYKAYTSSIGFQGFFFSLVDNLLDKFKIIDLDKRVDFFHAITSLLLAFSLSFIILLLSFEIGFIPVLLVLGTIIFSQWLVLGAKNLYWMTGLLFIPMLLVWATHKYEEIYNKFYIKLTLLLVIVSLFVKLSAGYEYVSTILLSTLVPIIYFTIKNEWPIKKFLKRFVLIGIAGLFGFFITFFTQIILTSLATNTTITKELSHKIDHAKSRMYAEKNLFIQPRWNEASQSSYSEVLDMYWKSEAINFNKLYNWKFFTKVTYGDFILIFLIFSALALISKDYSTNIELNRRKLIALIAATWFSVLVTISWYILAKVHSYVHVFLNNILWHIPFMIFGFSLVCFIVYLLLKDLYKFNKYILRAVLGIFFIIILSLPLFNILESNKKISTMLVNSNKIHIWQENIEANRIISQETVPYNISDRNWERGVSKNISGFFIEKNIENNYLLKDGILIFEFSGIRKITKISSNGRYINIEVNGSKLNPLEDGYPHKINIINKVRYESGT